MASSQNHSSSIKRKFIVLNQMYGQALLNDAAAVHAPTKVFPGELFEELFVADDRENHVILSLMSIDRKDIILESGLGDIKEVGSYGANLLLPIKTYDRRLELLNKNRLEDAISFEYGSPVTIQRGDMIYPGTVRYSGALRGRGEGIYFGVELPHHPGHGDSDGSVDGFYYFHCPANSSVFSSIDMLHPLDTRSPKPANDDTLGNSDVSRRNLAIEQSINQPKSHVVNRRDIPQLPAKAPSKDAYPVFPANEDSQPRSEFVSVVHEETKKRVGGLSSLAYGTASIGSQIMKGVGQRLSPHNPGEERYRPAAVAASVLEKLPFHLHDRVLFFPNDNGDRFVGTVRWIGRISRTDERLYAGLELDEQVGNGTGVLGGEQLFVTQPNHAVFAPCDGLIKVDNAHDLLDQLSGQPGRTRPEVALERKLSYSDMAKKAVPAAPPSNYRNNIDMPRLATRFPPQQEQQPPRRDTTTQLVKPSSSYSQLSSFQAAQNSPKISEKSNQIQFEVTVTKTKIPKKSPSPDSAKEYQKIASATLQTTPWLGSSTNKMISDALNVHPETGLSPEPPARTVDLPFSEKKFCLEPNGHPCNPSSAPSTTSGRRRQLKPVQSSSVCLRSVLPDTEFGKRRGIQGHKNSCYLDATLFGMFAFSNVFDNLLFRERRKGDIHGFEEIRDVLEELIVKPLRNTLYVRCEDVMKLRELMDFHSDITGLTDQEKDPEEFLSSLLEQILKIDPLLKMTSDDANWYTLFVEKNFNTPVPTVQELFDQSLMISDVRFKEAPKCLILQTPRSGAQYKMYRLILPSPTIDITDAIVGHARSCCICQDLALLECKECYGQIKDEFISNLSSMAFCPTCFTQRHKKRDLQHHRPVNLQISTNPDQKDERVLMELFAVLCIKTSHYVTFAQDGDGMWYFVDSMADREGEGPNGFNIPEVRPCPEVRDYLDPQNGRKLLLEHLEANQPLPEPINRFFEDCYLCMYQPKSQLSNSQVNLPQRINTSSTV